MATSWHSTVTCRLVAVAMLVAGWPAHVGAQEEHKHAVMVRQREQIRAAMATLESAMQRTEMTLQRTLSLTQRMAEGPAAEPGGTPGEWRALAVEVNDSACALAARLRKIAEETRRILRDEKATQERSMPVDMDHSAHVSAGAQAERSRKLRQLSDDVSLETQAARQVQASARGLVASGSTTQDQAMRKDAEQLLKLTGTLATESEMVRKAMEDLTQRMGISPE